MLAAFRQAGRTKQGGRLDRSSNKREQQPRSGLRIQAAETDVLHTIVTLSRYIPETLSARRMRRHDDFIRT